MAILTELRDPRVRNVTVTFVEISGDMRHAKVHVSIMGDEKQQDLCLHGLRRAAGFLQQKLKSRIDTRYTPRLQFVLDQGIKHSFKVAEILQEVLPHDDTADDQADEADAPDHDVSDNDAIDNDAIDVDAIDVDAIDDDAIDDDVTDQDIPDEER